MKPIKNKKCTVCKTEFKQYHTTDKYCSRLCMINNQKSKRSYNWSPEKAKNREGDKNPSFIHGLRSRGKRYSSKGESLVQKNGNEIINQMILENGFSSCQKCGQSGVRLEKHHIIFRSEKPNHEHLHRKENLIIVCVPCHNWFHKSKQNRNALVKTRNLGAFFGQDVENK